MSDAPARADHDRDLVQRRTVRVLMVSVVPAGMAMAGGFAGAAVLAEEITGSDTLAGLAAATHSVGGALATVPLARLAARRGRRPGLRTGWGLAAVGASLAFAAAVAELYPLLLLGVLGVGAGNATNLAARYAAADLAPEGRQARAIGLLVWAVTVGSVLGPTLALGPAGGFAELIGLPELAGPYLLSALGFAAAASVVERFLRPDPLEVAGSIDVPGTRRPPVRDSFRALWRSPTARLAVFTMGLGQAVMVGIMTMTPLHMKDGNHELRVIGFVISVHILGMYACSPIVGWLVDRLGPHPVIALGGVTLFIGAELASHTDPEDRLGIFVGLFLIGLGWSFGLISASALLAGAADVTDRVAVQGAADLVMVGSGAAAGLLAGAVVEWTSFHSLSHWAGVAALALVAVAGRTYFTRSRVPTPS
ncbi:MAG: MFS transporter [Actinomycetota bacterium]